MVLKKAVTLIEVLIVMAILAILMIAAIVGLNPTYQVNKGKDATRKKDLKRISIAFEEYYNDHLCYPSADLMAEFSNVNNCKERIDGFPQLVPWPCDPDGRPYTLNYDSSDCPRWFVVTTKLQAEKSDKECNYGVSSTNKKWVDETCANTEAQMIPAGVNPTSTPVPPTPFPTAIGCCNRTDCHTSTGGVDLNGDGNNCNSAGIGGCGPGQNCYYSGSGCPGYSDNPCLSVCKTSSCGQ